MDVTGQCPQCGAELQSAGSSQGLCPACLMKLGLSGAIPAPEEPRAEERSQSPEPRPAAPSGIPRPGSGQTGQEAMLHRPWRVPRLAWLLVVPALAVLAAAVVGVRTIRPVTRAPEVRLTIVTPETADPVSLAVSPDGRVVVFAALHEGRPQLWMRPMDSVSARPLQGTEGASYPFWSPDSRHIGFFADGKLKRIGVDGGSTQTLANAPSGAGGTWNARGDIVFAPMDDEPLARASARGGEVTMLTRLESPRETGHRFPQFLPGGRHLLFYVAGDPDTRGVYVLSTESGERRRLLDADAAAVYAYPAHLLFARDGTLFALKFDPGRLETIGDPFRVADGVAVNAEAHVAAVSTSAAGPLVYRTGLAREQRQLMWFDRVGRLLGEGDGSTNPLGERESIGAPAISPDGGRLAFHKTVNGNTDIWVLDIARGVLSRVTYDPASDARPVWSPDGSRILFHSKRKGSIDIYQKPANGAGSEELLLDGPGDTVVTDWSSDGRFLIYQSRQTASKTGWDIRALPLEGNRQPLPVVQTAFDEADAQFSPDGRWIAYQSNESGRFEIFVRSFPGPDAMLQVTAGGAVHARWRRDGRELFFVAPDGMLMAVSTLARGGSVESGRPVALFDARLGAVRNSEPQYAVSPDGQRFLLNTMTGDASAPLTVILNWKAGPE